MVIAETAIESVSLEPSLELAYNPGSNWEGIFGAIKIADDANVWVHRTIAIDAISDLVRRHFDEPNTGEHRILDDFSSIVTCLRTGVAAHRVEEEIVRPVRVLTRPFGNLVFGMIRSLTL